MARRVCWAWVSFWARHCYTFCGVARETLGKFLAGGLAVSCPQFATSPFFLFHSVSHFVTGHCRSCQPGDIRLDSHHCVLPGRAGAVLAFPSFEIGSSFWRGGKAWPKLLLLRGHCRFQAANASCRQRPQTTMQSRVWVLGPPGQGYTPALPVAPGSRDEGRCHLFQHGRHTVIGLTVGLAFLVLAFGRIGVPRRGSFCPWIGCRVGEASHPGPCLPGQFLTVAVVNPTAVLHKAKTFAQVNAQVILVSESSATAHVQAIMSPKFRREGFRTFWGEPVPEQQKLASGRCLRGLAAGTAVFSSIPARPSVLPFPSEQQQSCRISECFVRLHAIEIRIIVVYGFPTCHAQAAAKNNMLLSWAYQRATASQVPTLIGGDMNTAPQQLPVWQAFQQQGWVEVGEFMQCAHDVTLPPTCKGATSPDTILVPPCLQQYLQGADVLSGCGLFDAHEPLRVHFRFPKTSLQTMQWRMPKSWAEFVDAPCQIKLPYQQRRHAVQQACHSLQQQKDDIETGQTVLGRSLQVWSAVVEDSVSHSIAERAAREPHLEWPPGLPRAYRGRCVSRERQARHLPRLPRRGRHGQPQPVAEATSVQARHKLRQCRRLHVLLQGCKKLASQPVAPGSRQLREHLQRQWEAVCRAAGYGCPFLHWALTWPEIDFVPLGLPLVEQVGLLLQLARFDQEAHAQAEAKVRQQRFRHQVQIEVSEKGAGPSCARIKPLPPEPLGMVHTSHECQGREISRSTWHCRTYEAPGADQFLLHQVVEVMGSTGIVAFAQDGFLRVVFNLAEDLVLPNTVSLRQCQFDCTPQGVAAALTNFWSPIWTRDQRDEEADIAKWPRFWAVVQGLESPCPDTPVNLADKGAWIHAARKLPVRKSTGVCGWSNHELRLLPDAALSDLAYFF